MAANEDLYTKCEQELSRLLQRRWLGGARDAELRKLLCRMYAGVDHARRLEGAGKFENAKEKARLDDLLRADLRDLDLDRALELADRWDHLLIENGDEEYLCTLLEAEYARVSAGTTAVTWKLLYGGRRIPVSEKFRRGEEIEERELTQARNRLHALYRSRMVLYSLYRARQAMKSQFLFMLAPLLLVLLVALGVALASRPDVTLAEAAVAGIAGAVGATMSGTFKLRDHVEHINALREFRPAIVVQPLLGAAAGLFLLLILESGLLELGASGPEWALVGAVAFVAGFSEPFLLGVVQRVAGIAEVEPPDSAERAPIEPAEEDASGSADGTGKPAAQKTGSTPTHDGD